VVSTEEFISPQRNIAAGSEARKKGCVTLLDKTETVLTEYNPKAVRQAGVTTESLVRMQARLIPLERQERGPADTL
jgi:hypothetical protein